MAKVSELFANTKQVIDIFLLRSGGKGLGKGGAKRHRKVLRDNIQGKLSDLTTSLLNKQSSIDVVRETFFD